jgi:flagellar biosynthesis protein FlhB
VYWRAALGAAGAGGAPAAALGLGLGEALRLLGPPLGAAAGAALLVGLAQTRGLVAPGAVEPRLDRLSPARGLGRVLGGAAAFQVGKGVVKGAAVAGLALWIVRPHLRGLTSLAGRPAAVALGALGALGQRLAVAVAAVALALGVVDLLAARRAHGRRLRMTREEVRREHKEAEGDPRHRAERQRLQREILEQRMVADVRKADFVVVNPEHIAVALRYDRARDAAPVVVASGERLLAERIKQAAREAGVPIFRDVSLARSLRALAEGDEIPPALYEAVAQVIRVVQGIPDEAPPDRTGPPPPGAPPAPRAAGWKRA